MFGNPEKVMQKSSHKMWPDSAGVLMAALKTELNIARSKPMDGTQTKKSHHV